MVDRLTDVQRSFNMSRVRGRDTKPEMTVRRVLHALGFRFRLHRRDLPGTPDIVLPRWKTVVMVSSCFFHGHRCDLFRWPATRPEFWRAKIEGNMARDRLAADRLMADGWRVVTVWECALKGKRKLASDELSRAVDTAIRECTPYCEIAGE